MPAYQNVKLHLQFEDNLDDLSGDNRAVTNVGAVFTTSEKYGTRAIRFNGGDWIEIPATGLGALTALDDDWTFRGWLQITSTGGADQTFFWIGDDSTATSDSLSLVYDGSNIKLRIWADGTEYTATGTASIFDFVWHHIAVECDVAGATVKVYVDGTEDISYAISGAITYGADIINAFTMGAKPDGSLDQRSGRDDDVQLVVGELVYGGSFTAPGELTVETNPTEEARAQFQSPLGEPSAVVSSTYAISIEIPSPLAAPRVYVLNDFSGLVTDPAIRYVMRITGSPIIEVPISSWQATLQTGSQQYLQCVIPAATPYLSDLSTRRGASEFVVYRSSFAGTTAVESEMARAPLSAISINSGPFRETATISGYSPAYSDSAPSGTKALTGIRSTFQTLGGNSRVRSNIDWFLRPGQTVSADGLTFTANYINYFVPSVGDAYMDVGSRG